MQKIRPSPTSSGNVFDYPSGRPDRGQRGLRGGRGYAAGGPPDLDFGRTQTQGPFGGFGMRPGFYGGRTGGLPEFDYYGYSSVTSTDEDIQADVYNTIMADPHIIRRDKDKIEVSVDSGMVSLGGEVSRRHSKISAYNDAFWRPGVIDVDNQIKLQPRLGPSA
ncbi:MAG TPA: BON domain-containing protein [Clostridia bacterium]|nr:BON domain-containing protein [Clostridia bacterium]